MTNPNLIGLRLLAMLHGLSREPREEGQTLAEYALILGLIALVVATVVALLGTSISSLFSKVAHQI